jgi:CDP-glycerol glycerophosphotransferase (TagB/SpsB family)
MKRYLFFVNAEYCYAILRPVQDVIRQRGDKAAWFVMGCSSAPLQADEAQLHTVQAVMDYAPDAVFSPGDWVPYFFPGKKVQVFHGIARNKRGAASEAESDHYRIRGWFDLYCTHAINDTERFQGLADRLQTFHVAHTGWPKLDPFFQARERYVHARSNDVPTVFFASTFSPSITAAPALADTIERLSTSGQWRFIVTLHPKMDASVVARYASIQHPNFEFVPAGDDFLPAMARADVMVCDTSSIMYEFMFLNKPLVTLNTRNPGPFLIDVDSPEALVGALQQALQRPADQLAAAQALCHDLHSFDDGRSSQRVMDAVEQLCAGTMGPRKTKPGNWWRKLKVRSRMGHWGW